MIPSKRTAAHFTYWEEAEVSDLIALRDRIKPLAEAEGVKLNFLPLIVKAVVASLRKNPQMNSVLDEEKSDMISTIFRNHRDPRAINYSNGVRCVVDPESAP